MIFIKSIFALNLFIIALGLAPKIKSKERGSENSFSIFILNFSLALIILVFSYSIIKSSFNSISIISIPVFITSIIINYKKINIVRFNFINDRIYLLKLLLVVNIIFVVKALFLFQFSGEYLKIAHPDYLFYARVSTFLNETGIESMFLNTYAKPTPYHYFELWLNSFFIEFGMNAYSSLMLIVYPIIMSLVVLLAYIVVVGLIPFKNAITFAGTILFVQLFFIPSLFVKIPFLYEASTFAVNPWWYQKISVLYMCFLLALAVNRYIGSNAMILTIALFLPIYGSMFFGVTGVLGAILLLKIFGNKSIQWNSVVIIFLSIISFLLFYNLNHYQNNITKEINVFFVKTSVNVVVGTLLRISIFVFPYLVCVFLFTKIRIIDTIKSHFHIILMFSIGVIASLFGWALLHTQLDSVQVFTNFSIPIICISIAFVIAKLDYRLVIILLFTIVCFNFSNYTYANSLSLTEDLEKVFEHRNKGVFIKKTTDYMNIFNINPVFSCPLPNIVIVNSKLKMYDISMVDVGLMNHPNADLLNNYLNKNELNRYSKQGHDISTKVSFILKNDIQFLICPLDYILAKELSSVFKYQKKIEDYVVWYK